MHYDWSMAEWVPTYDRRIELRMVQLGEDYFCMWGVIKGYAGDEVWLDFTYDKHDGSWEGPLLGSVVEAGSNSVTTGALALWYGRYIRACGSAGDRDEVQCTRWYPGGWL